MMLFDRIDSFVADDKIIGFTFVGAQGQRLELAFPIARIGDLCAGLLLAASQLPRTSQQSLDAAEIRGTIGVGIGPKLDPAFLLGFGPLTISIPSSEQRFKTLLADMQQLLQRLNGPKTLG